MNQFLPFRAASRSGLAFALMLGCLLLAGCRSSSTNPQEPYRFPGTEADGNSSRAADRVRDALKIGIPTTSDLRPGETIMVIFSDLPTEHALRPLELRIGEDGNITLYHNITIRAAGKTTTQLQEEIRNAYVPRLFKQLTVTVKGSTLWYFVGGEVRSPTKQEYVGLITVLRAIDTAGGFTEYADKTEIELIRSTGERYVINGKKAVRNPKLDLEIMPNDRIYVPRRFY